MASYTSYTYEYYYESESESEDEVTIKASYCNCSYIKYCKSDFCTMCFKKIRKSDNSWKPTRSPAFLKSSKTEKVSSFGYPRKKDGTRDMRYTQMCRLKKDGTPY